VLLANVLQTKIGAVPKSSVDVSSGVFFLAIFFLFRILSSLVVQILKKPGY
jgi:ABC-type Na+ efflux pump permease subunit